MYHFSDGRISQSFGKAYLSPGPNARISKIQSANQLIVWGKGLLEKLTVS